MGAVRYVALAHTAFIIEGWGYWELLYCVGGVY